MKSGKKLYKVKMAKPVLKSIARNIGSMEALFPVDNSKVYARILLAFLCTVVAIPVVTRLYKPY